MFGSRHEEFCDIDVVLRSSYIGKNEQAVASLQRNGLDVNNLDDSNGVVSGAIPADRLDDIRQLACVADLRVKLTYVAEAR